jgi:hypothetical protein
VQEASQELAREAIDDLALPRLERDLAVVLAAGAVLGERLRPARAAAYDAYAAVDGMGVATHATRKQRQHHRRPAVVDDRLIRGVADDDELVRAMSRRDAPIAEIHPQQVAVRPGVGRSPLHRERMFA